MKTKILSTFLFILALTVSAQEKVNFTEKFKKENQGKSTIEINEVKELLTIMLAITDFGLENDDMFEQKGDYYQRVLKHFKPYKEEAIIKTMNSLLSKNPLEYIFFTGNAQTYFLKNNVLLPNEAYILPANKVANVKIEVNPITTYKKEIEDFAKKSHFSDFYKSEKPFYDKIISNYEKYSNLRKQWNWLEKNFDTKINSYIVYTSALINGLNYTGGYENNNFHLIEMVLPTIEKVEGRSEKNSEAFNTRSMFTEIDHNYVEKPSVKYKEELNTVLKDREKWVNTKAYGTEYYPDGFKVFNEYMTYAVFILYAEETYKGDTQLLLEINNEVNAVMIDRGFIKMKEFNEELKNLRSKNKKKKIDDLYQELIKWCSLQ
ncbi:DUF4932 domain-containing protein [Flavobacterium notoginsengisoli]|uniref:DUF4932 domain-containing protein n=1 Tax=Flavobacterium notoginsengisoli TaxID=1478199 RepID=UPI00363E82D7